MTSSTFLTITDSSLSYVSQLCARFGRDNEIGGIGFGNYDENGHPVVMMLLPPGPNAEFSPTSFIDDPEYVNQAMGIVSDKYGQGIPCFWHSHPGSFCEPSSIDLAQSSRFAKKFGIQTLGYIILTAHAQYNEPRLRFWDRCLTTFSSRKNYPHITVNSYVFDLDQCQYEPCYVKVIDYNGIQEDILKTSLVSEHYKLPIYYPADRIRVVNAMETASSVPSGFTEEFSNLADLSVPDIYLKDGILTVQNRFSDEAELTMQYQLDGNDYELLKAKIYIDEKTKDITKAVRKYHSFCHAYVEASRLVSYHKEGKYNGS